MASKPVILCVDDDPSVLSAISRDLRRQYGQGYRLVRADSGDAALEALRELKQRNEPVALLLADQRMPGKNGVEFLTEAVQLYPDARRVLLTAYADTDAAIQAINQVGLNYYLLKPWDPPEEALYPVLDDQLEDWQAGYRPPFEGIRLVGHRWSPGSHQLKDFLARNQIPYQYLDVEQEEKNAVELLRQHGLEKAGLPVVVFPGGETMVAPDTLAVAEKIGLKRQAGRDFYDLAIVGGGPAGLAAAVYGASEGLRTVLIEREAPGGQAGTSSRIENYLGFPSGLSGADLARRATVQARRFGVEILHPVEAIGLRADGPYRVVCLANGSEIASHVVVVSVGLSYHKLDVPGMERLTGAGVFYGASLSEAISCRDQKIFIVGAGNSAGQAALHLVNYADRVIMVVRGVSLAEKMSQYLVDRIGASDNIEVRLHAEVAEVHGRDHLEAVTLCDNRTGDRAQEEAAALFIFIGARPQTDWLPAQVLRDERGFIPTGPDLMKNGKPPKGWSLDRDPYLLESSLPGVFVVGDVRAGSIKRVASAVGEGSIAVKFIHQYLSRVK